jgi:hypothetical protein
MKKYRDYDLDRDIDNYDFANLFTAYPDKFNNLVYNVSRSLVFTGIDNPQKNLVLKYRTISSDTWHLISYKYYGTPRLWWLLCKVNGIVDPMMQAMPEEINVLSKDLASAILNEIKIA